ncbi:hypothetical protein EDC96DRAFT_579628 [Choanephora cucurbitarum]|nr:hypothetical protein EDC96DRAFT_579628 [Choanephora cucurbitarum]
MDLSAVDDLALNFAELDIKKLRLVEFMKRELNLSVELVNRRHATYKREEGI